MCDSVEPSFEKELKELEILGLDNKRISLKLLRKTKGDFELVKNFLLAKNAIKLKTRQFKRENKLEKMMKKDTKDHKNKEDKKDKKFLKKERKCWDKKEKKYRKRMIKEGNTCNSNSTEEQVFGNLDVDLIRLPTKQSWPSGVTHLYLDGNNMLFVLSPIRSLVLKRKNRMAEEALEALAKKFSEALNLEYCTLIFDDTKRVL